DSLLVAVLTDDLEPDGEPARAEATGEGDGRHAGEVHGDGEDVREVHLERILYLLPETEGRGRGSGGTDHVASFKGLFKIGLNEGPYLGGLPVVGVVVAGGKDIGSQHDPALHLLAEPLGAGLLVHLHELLRLGCTKAVFHAVISG